MMVIDCTFICVFLVFVRIVLAEEESLCKLTVSKLNDHIQLLVLNFIYIIVLQTTSSYSSLIRKN